jgi:hypothetical protein
MLVGRRMNGPERSRIERIKRSPVRERRDDSWDRSRADAQPWRLKGLLSDGSATSSMLIPPNAERKECVANRAV